MARDTVTVTSTVRAGVLPTLNTPNAANNAEMANGGGKTIFVFVNGMGLASVQATDITVQQVDCSHGRIENDPAHTCAVDIVAVLGPFPPMIYNQTDGTVQIDYDAVSANARCFGLSITGA